MKLVVGMLVKNEASRYLLDVIETLNLFADTLVVLDDNSTDDSIAMIRSASRMPVIVEKVGDSGSFANEIVLRKWLYHLVLHENPDWYMIVDADEIYCATRSDFDLLMNQDKIDVWGFRLYDMWDGSHYRSDHLWRAHEFHSLMLVRNIPGFKPEWKETAHHCGRLPLNLWSLRTGGTELVKIKHYGWARFDDRVKKYARYMQHDPLGMYGSLEQYQSILDKYPNLVRWEG